MNSIEELCVNLAAEKDRLVEHSSSISRIVFEINEAINRAQTYFSDQAAGQEIIHLLAKALNELALADNAFYALGADITTYIAELQK